MQLEESNISGFSEDGKVTIGKYDLQGHGIGAVSLRMDGSWTWEFEGFEVQTDSSVGAGEGNVGIQVGGRLRASGSGGWAPIFLLQSAHPPLSHTFSFK